MMGVQCTLIIFENDFINIGFYGKIEKNKRKG